jgi:hypothetical protein
VDQIEESGITGCGTARVLCQGTTLRTAEKLVDRISKGSFVSGHDFSRAANLAESQRALAPECKREGRNDMHGSGIPIWFFIGVLLAVYGAMIFGASG